MNIYEFDWRISTTKVTLSALTAGLQDLIGQLKISEQDDNNWFGLDIALELSEGIFGIAFIATQNYINGTVSDIKDNYKNVSSSETKFNKYQLIKEQNDYLPRLPITQLELCNAVANYYKHYEEWDDWEPKGRRKDTILALKSANIGEDDLYPCHKAAQLIHPNASQDLAPLATILSNWRSSTISVLNEKYQADY